MPKNTITGKIWIIGAGAIGGLVGARLTEALGKECVTLVDADQEHVKAIKDRGFIICDRGRNTPQPETIDVEITTPDRIDKMLLDNVILAAKSYSNGQALRGLRRDIPLLVLQNGYDERLERFPNAVRGVEFGFACQVSEPGFIYNAVKGKYVLGCSDGAGEQVKNWAQLLNWAQIKAEVAGNIDGYLWSKLLINSALNPVSAIRKSSFKNLIETRDSRELFKELYREGYPIVLRKSQQLGQKLGSFLGPPNIVNWIFQKQRLSDFVLNLVAAKFGEVESSMLQDIRKNRPTEVDYINGAISRLGAQYGIETPKNDWIRAEVAKLEPKCSMQ